MTLRINKSISRSKSGYALALLLIGAVAISLAPIFVRISTLEPVVSAFYRMFFAAPFFLALPFLSPANSNGQKKSRIRVTLRDGMLIFLCGLMLAIDLALWHISINWTSVANATLFNNCAPIILLLFGWLFLGERVTSGVIVALAVAVVGMVLLSGENFAYSPDQFAGDMVAASTAVFYALYLLLVKALRAQYDTFTIMFGTSVASAICLFAVSLINGWVLVPPNLGGWMIVFGLALICHVIGQSLIAYALADIPVSISSFGLLLQPVSAAILAWLLFNETLTGLQVLGGLLVLCGTVLSNQAGRSMKR